MTIWKVALQIKQNTAPTKKIMKTAVSIQVVAAWVVMWVELNVATKKRNRTAPIKWLWILIVSL